ncbi:MAG TPA: threonine/serine dehydratase [Gemmatimonadaceae bacterium]|nr:threonine/serine dehydratase [Gemmatimonadaceae bacterium]
MSGRTVTTKPRPTTFLDAPRLSDDLGLELVLACETFQITGSFKFRAAWSLAANVPNPHVIAASSGNFGQALALACKLFGKRSTIVMPANSARVKIDAVRTNGGTVDLVDTTKTPRAERVAALADADPEAYVASAYDDRWVIEGNATLGDEVCQRDPRPEVIVVPVGGGGLASGIVSAVRAAGLAGSVAVVGAEPALANDAARSLREGRIVANESEPQTMADGARTLSVGEQNWALLRDGLETIVEVPEERIVEALRRYFVQANLKVEPTGALALGAILANPERFSGRRTCCVISGGNVDPAVYARLLVD